VLAQVRAAEDVVRRWGYDEMILEVEEGNAAARRLYNVSGPLYMTCHVARS
jgi:hypothetical protein